MVGRRRLDRRFAFAFPAVHHHRRRPVLEVLEGRVVLATFTVNSLGDAGSGSNGSGDVRYCINQANANDEANTIVFDSTVFSTPETITLSGSPLELAGTGGTQTITGPATGVTISGGGTSRVFQVDSGVTASLSGLTITGGSTSGYGGGLYNEGTAKLTACTVSGNSAREGGGLFDSGNSKLTATLTLTDCTVSGNSALEGGGLFNSSNSKRNATTLTLTACTVSGNSAGGSSAGGLANDYTANLTDTIVAGNTNPSGASDIGGAHNVLGSYNLVGTGGSGGLVNGVDGNIVLTSLTDLGLASLSDYGGPTQTMALLPNSPAIGAGVIADYPGTTNPITTDQRGFPLDSPNPDIGAFQSQPELVVNTTSDASYGILSPPGELSLRQAVGLADFLGGNQTITFDPTVFATAQTIALTSGQLELSDISGEVTITAPAGGVTISGGGNSRIFQVDSGVTAALSGLTITGGSTSAVGGGLYNQGTANLTDCTVSGNSAGFGGGLFNSSTANLTLTACTVSSNSASFGGGLENAGSATLGTATLTDCTISGNSAVSGGGLENAGTATLTACTVSGNSASGDSAGPGGSVGGVYNHGQATLTDTIVAGNSNPSGASDIGGTRDVLGSNNLVGTGGSGGLANGESGNIVLTSLADLGLAPLGNDGGPTQTMALLPGSAAIGAGIVVSGVTTDQRGFPLDSPNPDIGAFQTQPALVVNTTSDGTELPAGDLSLRQAVNLANVLTGAQSVSFDPTVFASPQTIMLTRGQLELSNSSGTETITGPAAGVTINAGGNSRVFQVDRGVTTALSALTITGGSTTGGGGLFNVGTAALTDCTLSGNSADSGGGLDNPYKATLTLTDCTISGNSAKYDGGGLDNLGTATLTDCTVSGNSAGFGGGLFNSHTASLTNCTLSGSFANGKNGGGYAPGGLANYDTATLTDTIVAGNTNPSGASDIGGDSNVSGSNNLVGTGGSGGLANGESGNIVLTSLADLGLAPLGNDGGPTQTMALLPGSAAIGAGIVVSGVTTDQRGFPLDSPNPDIGAFQTQPALVVNTTSDGTELPAGDLSLRQAVNLANVLTGAQSISFDPTVFAGPQTIMLTGGQLELSNSSGTETITGPAAGATIDAGGQSRVFQVDSGVTAALSGLTITDGSSSGYGGGLYNEGTATFTGCTISGNSAFSGGGVYNDGTATLTDCTLSGNYGSNHGGGVFDYGAATLTLTECIVSGNSSGAGGGLDNGYGTATLTLSHCTLSDNSAYQGGGVYNRGTANLADCTVSGNSAGYAGGLGNYGTATLTDCTVSDNVASLGGGMYSGMHNRGMADLTLTDCTVGGNTAYYKGGGVFNYATATLTDCTLSGNTASDDGGGLYNDYKANLTLTACTVSGNSTSTGGGALHNFGTATLTNCTVSGNSASQIGGGLLNDGMANLTDCRLSGNSAYSGGGGVNNRGTSNLADCTVSGNSVSGNAAIFAGGGGLDNYGTANLSGCTISGNSASRVGGGLENQGMANLILSGCTVSGNSAYTGGGVFGYECTANLTDCTLSGNSASSGGGLYDDYKASLTLTGCTVSGNAAYQVGGGLVNDYTANLTDTIVAGNTNPAGASDIGGDSNLSGSYNLLGTGGSGGLVNGVNGNIVLTSLTDLGLAPLGDYGGPTQTIALLPGSPALGAGIAVSGVTTDQRGEPLDTPNPDIGAFQSQGFTLTPSANSTPQSTTVGSAFANPLAVTVTANNRVEPVAGGVLTFLAPASGSSAILSASTASIGSDGGASVTATANAAVGSYTVSASAGGDATADFALTNTAVLISLSFSRVSDESITYGTASVTVSGTLANGSQAPVGESVAVTLGGVQQSATIGSSGAFSTTFNTAGLAVAGSPDTVNYAYTSDGTFASASTSSSLTITPATLTITPHPETKVYGTADPALAYTASGFQFNDTAAKALTGSLVRAQAGTLAGEQAGGYVITQGTLAADSNYTIHFTGSTLAITPATLTVTANPQTKVYGTADPTLTVTPVGLVDATVDGVAIDDTAATALSGSPARAQAGTVAGEQVGSYTIAQGTLLADGNYTIHFTGSSLTVTPATLTITAGAQTKVYGTSDPSLTDGATGLVDTTVDGVMIADTVASILTGSLARAQAGTLAGEQAGTYAITRGTLGAGNNYTIQFAGSTLNITPAPLTVTANPQTKPYGSADPALTDTLTGLVDTAVDGVTIVDTAATVLTGTLARAAGETVAGSPYTITQGTLAAGSNYTIHFTTSTLSITPARPTVSVLVPGGVYTGAPIAAQATVTGVSGAADASLEGITPTLTYFVGSGTSGTDLGATAPTAVGTYTVVASFPGSADYAPSQSKPATFAIAPGAATIALTPSVSTAVYGQTVTFVATVTSPAGPPSGTVTFLDGASPLATFALNGSGQAALSVSSLALGSQAITATYNGNADFQGVSSSPTTESVRPAATAIVLVPHAVVKGKTALKAVELTAEIEPVPPGRGVPTGKVTFEFVKRVRKTVKVKTLGTATVSGGEATLTFKPNAVLNETLTIIYSGDTDFLASSVSPPKLTKPALV